MVDRDANSKDSDLAAVKNLDSQRKKLEPKFVEQDDQGVGGQAH